MMGGCAFSMLPQVGLPPCATSIVAFGQPPRARAPLPAYLLAIPVAERLAAGLAPNETK